MGGKDGAGEVKGVDKVLGVDKVYIYIYILFIGIHTLCLNVTRGYGDHSPLTTALTTTGPKEEVMAGGLYSVTEGTYEERERERERDDYY
jgi:hypothetical protein